MTLRARITKPVAFAGVLAFACAGGIAFAAVPDAAGVIHGCRDNATGTLRVIDDTGACATGETALNWSQDGLNWKGAWSSTASYGRNDAVYYLVSSWIAKQTVPAGARPGNSNVAYWDALAAKGDTGIVWRGTWSDTRAYVVREAVSYLGSSYLAIAASPAGTLPTDTTRWSTLAAKGATGPTGGTLPSTRWYRDADADGFGDWYDVMDSAVKPAGFVSNNTDCNDDLNTVRPNSGTNSGIGWDYDCDGLANETAIAWYRDGDGDGYGGGTALYNQTGFMKGYTTRPHDCNDSDTSVTTACFTTRRDSDGDGHYLLTVNEATSGDDCNDAHRQIYPGAREVLFDGLDNDCNPQTADVEKRVAGVVGRHDPIEWGVFKPAVRAGCRPSPLCFS